MKNKLTLFKCLAIILLYIGVCSPAARAGEAFSTWDGFEVDKLASIWLIQRHISPGAEIRIFPTGEAITEGTPFDAPSAAIQRTFNQSSFESLAAHYHLEDPGVRNMALLIRDVEINTWEAKSYKITREMEAHIVNLIKTHTDAQTLIRKSNLYLDGLYKRVSGGLEKNSG